MPLGEYTVTLRVTGSFRDARDAAYRIKEAAEKTISREQAADRSFQQNHFSPGGGVGWSESPPQIRKIEIV